LAGPGGVSLSHEETVSVVSVRDGLLTSVARGLPSTDGMGGHAQGPSAIAFWEDRLHVLQDAGATAYGASDHPNGVYAVNDDGGVSLIADIATWITSHPVAHVPADFSPNGEPFGMAVVGEELWVVESNSGQVLAIAATGEIARVADLSVGHPLPTAPSASPHGGVYVGFLTPAPYPDGASKVLEIGADGTISEVWDGLTMVTAVAVDQDGALYALQMSTRNASTSPYVRPASGKIVRQSGTRTSADIASGLPYPIAMAFGPDGCLYIAAPAYGATDSAGFIARIDVSA
jgi:hypothetical protein